MNTANAIKNKIGDNKTMEITPEIQAEIDKRVKEEADKASAEIVKTINENYEQKIEALNEAHKKEVEAYKSTISEIIQGKNEPEKTKMQTLVDEINDRRAKNNKEVNFK